MPAELSRRSLLKAAGLTAGAVGVASLGFACGPAAGPAALPSSGVPRRGGTLTYAASADIVSLDPPNIGDTVSANAQLLIYEGLVAQTPDLELLPSLATSWEVNDLAWTFKLRTGVQFHDATPFNAAAVKFVFDRILGPERTLRKGIWAAILERVEVVDDGTVRFVTKYTDPFFPTRVVANASGAIFSPAAFRRLGADLAKNPVGTGPFRFVEWVKDDHLTVERFDGYWGGAAYLDRVVIRPVPEAETRVIALEAGDVQLAIRLNPEHVARVQQNARLKLLRTDTTRHYYMGLANLKRPWSDVRVRQALNYAVDKQGLINNLFQGLAKLQNGLLPLGTPGYVDLPGFPYDPAKAKQLLNDAGYPNGFSASFVGPKGSYLKDFELMQALQQQWKAVGVEIKLDIVEFAKYLELLRMDPKQSPLEMWFDTMAGGGQGPDYFINRFGCDSFRPVGTNTAGSCDPGIDRLAAEAQRTLDPAKRNQLMKDAQEQLSRAAPAVWLFSIAQIAGTSARVHDAVFTRNENLTVDAHTWLEA